MFLRAIRVGRVGVLGLRRADAEVGFGVMRRSRVVGMRRVEWRWRGAEKRGLASFEGGREGVRGVEGGVNGVKSGRSGVKSGVDGVKSGVDGVKVQGREVGEGGGEKVEEVVESMEAGWPKVRFQDAPLVWLKAVRSQFGTLMARYSALAITFYAGLYVVTLSSVFGLVHTHIIKIPDPTKTLRKISLLRQLWGEDFELSPFWVEFVGAWILTKTTEPIRAVVTLVAIPILARKLPPSVMRAFGVRVTQAGKAVRKRYHKFRENRREAREGERSG